MNLFPYEPSHNLLPLDGIVNYYGPILTPGEADDYLEALLTTVPWKSDEAIIYGKHIVTARKVAWYGDSSYSYTYSGTTKIALPWTRELLALKKLVEDKAQCSFNSCLCNLYHSGSEGMGWHSDDETALGKDAANAWFDHVDGPKFTESQRDQFRSIGHWLFLPGAFSSFHKVKNNEEIWMAQSGCVVVHILEPGGKHRTVKVGLNLAGGEQPLVIVPAGYWQAAELLEGEPYAFGTNVCAPAFLYSEFEMAKREDLLKEFPQHGNLIRHLTRV